MGGTYQDRLEAVYQCPNADCERLFLAFFLDVNKEPGGRAFYFLRHLAPMAVKEVSFGEELLALSPAFAKIYNQAAAAEAHQLDEIAGAGYRKALEFLVKDFAIKQAQDKAEEIKAASLKNVIDGYITDANAQQMATFAAWLGNDEVHYLRKWTSQDIDDLKSLIHLVKNDVENVLLMEKYKATMSKPSGG